MAGDSQAEYQGKIDEYFAKAPGKRFQIIFAGPLLNYVLGFIFLVYFFIGYPSWTSKVGGLIDGYGAKEAGLQVADKILTVDDKRVDIWEDLQQAVRNGKKNKIECFAKKFYAVTRN